MARLTNFRHEPAMRATATDKLAKSLLQNFPGRTERPEVPYRFYASTEEELAALRGVPDYILKTVAWDQITMPQRLYYVEFHDDRGFVNGEDVWLLEINKLRQAEESFMDRMRGFSTSKLAEDRKALIQETAYLNGFMARPTLQFMRLCGLASLYNPIALATLRRLVRHMPKAGEDFDASLAILAQSSDSALRGAAGRAFSDALAELNQSRSVLPRNETRAPVNILASGSWRTASLVITFALSGLLVATAWRASARFRRHLFSNPPADRQAIPWSDPIFADSYLIPGAVVKAGKEAGFWQADAQEPARLQVLQGAATRDRYDRFLKRLEDQKDGEKIREALSAYPEDGFLLVRGTILHRYVLLIDEETVRKNRGRLPTTAEHLLAHQLFETDPDRDALDSAYSRHAPGDLKQNLKSLFDPSKEFWPHVIGPRSLKASDSLLVLIGDRYASLADLGESLATLRERLRLQTPLLERAIQDRLDDKKTGISNGLLWDGKFRAAA